MRRYGVVLKDFIKTNERIANNSLMFDNICEKEVLKDESSPNNKNKSNIQLYRNIIIDRYIEDLIENADTYKVSNNTDYELLKFNPKLLSELLYGVSDYWWLILSMNGYMSVYEFRDFDVLLVPNEDHVDSIMTEIIFNRE